ncbi:Major facilitator superfamily domain general substrate transporter [Penicillium taxi]|uniref:Major facilitator superfamily domain general substrate transporter n=1 Tax=Penicillium taxi TaxID=168475 RepID=UPI002545A96A|nr:Major facilitator superfamily domain general substrate transporter [Penicillium taxi]KAJ5901568.1 Major facilitator superfamily domain general substrate transporter [Penicillium taxi]
MDIETRKSHITNTTEDTDIGIIGLLSHTRLASSRPGRTIINGGVTSFGKLIIKGLTHDAFVCSLVLAIQMPTTMASYTKRSTNAALVFLAVCVRILLMRQNR